MSESASFSLTLSMRPIAFARAGRGNGHSYTPKPQAEFMEAVGHAAKAAMSKAGLPVMTGPLEMVYRATYAYPKSWPEKRRRDTTFKTSTPDCDNLTKIAADSLEWIVFENDSQIVRITADKRYGAEDAVHIIIQQLTDTEAA